MLLREICLVELPFFRLLLNMFPSCHEGSSVIPTRRFYFIKCFWGFKLHFWPVFSRILQEFRSIPPTVIGLQLSDPQTTCSTVSRINAVGTCRLCSGLVLVDLADVMCDEWFCSSFFALESNITQSCY